jgi:fucose permease
MQENAMVLQDRKLKQFVALLFLSFICYALFTVLLGSQAPLMMRYYNITETEQGFLTSMLSIGGITAAAVCALFGESFKKFKTLWLGLAILSAATLLIVFAPPYTVVVICALFAGIAYTLIDIMVNSSFTQYFSSNAKTLLPMAHMFFGIGAMIGPYLMTTIINPDIPKTFTRPFLFVGLMTAVIFILYSFSAPKAAPLLQKGAPPKTKSKPADVFTTGRFWSVLAGGILFCCFSTGIIAWLPTYFNQTRGFSLEMSGLMLTLFFSGALLMRFLGPFFFSRIKPQRIFVVFSILSILFMIAAFLSNILLLTVIFIIIGGAFQSLNMAALIFIGCALFPDRHASATSIAIFAYNIGGIIAPVLLGALAQSTGFQIPMLLSCILFAAGVAVISIISIKYKQALKNA